jgi:hypothetical protein
MMNNINFFYKSWFSSREKSIAIAICENVWFKQFLNFYPRVVFLHNFFFHEILPKLVEKMKQIYVFTKIGRLYICNKFDLWMSNILAFVIYFLGFYWQFKKAIIGLFEATKILVKPWPPI